MSDGEKRCFLEALFGRSLSIGMAIRPVIVSSIAEPGRLAVLQIDSSLHRSIGGPCFILCISPSSRQITRGGCEVYL